MRAAARAGMRASLPIEASGFWGIDSSAEMVKVALKRPVAVNLEFSVANLTSFNRDNSGRFMTEVSRETRRAPHKPR
jgi:hypothetical protein